MDPISESDDDRPVLGRRDGLRKTARSARKASSCLQGGPARTGGLPLDSPVMPTFMGSLQVFLPIKQIKLTPCLSTPLRKKGRRAHPRSVVRQTSIQASRVGSSISRRRSATTHSVGETSVMAGITAR